MIIFGQYCNRDSSSLSEIGFREKVFIRQFENLLILFSTYFTTNCDLKYCTLLLSVLVNKKVRHYCLTQTNQNYKTCLIEQTNYQYKCCLFLKYRNSMMLLGIGLLFQCSWITNAAPSAVP